MKLDGLKFSCRLNGGRKILDTNITDRRTSTRTGTSLFRGAPSDPRMVQAQRDQGDLKVKIDDSAVSICRMLIKIFPSKIIGLRVPENKDRLSRTVTMQDERDLCVISLDVRPHKNGVHQILWTRKRNLEPVGSGHGSLSDTKGVVKEIALIFGLPSERVDEILEQF